MSGNQYNEPHILRAAALKQFSQLLRRIERSSVPKATLINLHGAQGLGKTWMLRQAFEAFQTESMACFLSFDGSDTATFPHQVCGWPEALAMLRMIPEFHQLESPLGFENRSVVLDYSFEAADKPILLLLDGLDELSIWRWLQEQVIKPLMRTSRALVVCASQAPIAWHFWELRRLCRLQLVAPLTQDETRQFLSFFDRELLTETSYTLTHGYPRALAELMHQLDASTSQDATTIDFTRLAPTTRQAVPYVGLLRIGDVAIMREILTAFAPEYQNAPPSLPQLHQLLADLHTHGYLAKYARGRSPERLIPALRRSAITALHADRPGLYPRIMRAIADQYYGRALARRGTDSYAAVEWLYYSANLVSKGADSDLAEWDRQLRSLLKTAQPVIGELVTLLMRDSETLACLRKIDKLAMTKRLLSKSLDQQSDAHNPISRQGAANLPILDDFSTIRRTILDPIAEDLAQASPSLHIPANLDALLRQLVETEGTFDTTQLLSQMNADPNIPTMSRREIDTIAMRLNQQGWLMYDREQRKYQPDPVLRGLAPFTYPPSHTPQLQESSHKNIHHERKRGKNG